MGGQPFGMNDEQLFQILTELNYLTPEDLKKAQQLAKTGEISLYAALLKNDLISDENLGKLIAYSLQLPFVSLTQATVPPEILHLTPQRVADQQKLITFSLDAKTLKIATPNYLNTDL